MDAVVHFARRSLAAYLATCDADEVARFEAAINELRAAVDSHDAATEEDL